MPYTTAGKTPLRVTDLEHNDANAFDIRPNADDLKILARDMGLLSLRKVRLVGEICAHGKQDWQLVAKFGATIVQTCVVTLASVTTRIDRPVKRTFLAQWDQPTDEEVEMHEDESIDPLGSHIDLSTILAEALALALPLYPRADGANIEQANFTEPGKTPLSDETAKPFAGLAGLRDALDDPTSDP